MFKRMIKTTWSLLVILGLIGLAPAATVAAQTSDVACAQEYTVQAGDWLSSIAQSTYGDQAAYPAIVEATNAQTDDGFATIDNPDVIEVGWTLCLPSQTEAQAMMGQTDQMEQMEQQMEQTELMAPEGQMLMVLRNQSATNATSTFTISGGEFGGGEQFTIDAGERTELNLEPGDYRVIWSSPSAEEISFGRSFTAVAGRIATARIIPESEQVFFNFNVNQQQQMTEAAEATQETTQMMNQEFPFEAPAGKGMLVVGNRSGQNIPSTLTITGDRFGGGEQISVDPGDEVFLPVEPGEYTVVWSTPIDADDETGSPVIVSRDVQISAGETPFWWIVPEEFQAFSQVEGEVPTELAQ